MASITLRPPTAISSSTTSSPSATPTLASASTMPTSVGSKQGDDPGTIRFTNMQDLFNHKFCFHYFNIKSQILIITIPTNLHKELHKRLYNKFVRQVHDMGLKKSWRDIASATCPAQQGHSGRRGKEGDSSGGPKPEQAGNGAWPTLVIKAGVSQMLAQLRIGMRRWFPCQPTRSRLFFLPSLTPVLRQAITITQDTTTDPISYHVTSGALVLSFRLFFLRDPGPGEGDLAFGVQELEEYAEDVWAQV
ncbi:hypothetical protein B0T25DRAFT_589228 [Lasiosphaeria hispida]|uniref:Uncharacterized protein n=1 Tax=Lasiosphaeria hispida TaxID=260671 RepID=A0AAJ0HL95_9PEZI|nr:hypothetical protein B0T25DRAFT_589228 [Lasiosphaeria hispida]